MLPTTFIFPNATSNFEIAIAHSIGIQVQCRNGLLWLFQRCQARLGQARRYEKKKKTPTNTTLLTCNLGVNKIDIDLEKQEVVVDTELARDTVLEAIKKTGKKVNE